MWRRLGRVRDGREPVIGSTFFMRPQTRGRSALEATLRMALRTHLDGRTAGQLQGCLCSA